MTDIELPQARTKTCTSCGDDQSIYAFPADPQHNDGHSSHCKSCRRDEMQRLRSLETPLRREQRLQDNRTYRAAETLLRQRHHAEFTQILTELRTTAPVPHSSGALGLEPRNTLRKEP